MLLEGKVSTDPRNDQDGQDSQGDSVGKGTPGQDLAPSTDGRAESSLRLQPGVHVGPNHAGRLFLRQIPRCLTNRLEVSQQGAAGRAILRVGER